MSPKMKVLRHMYSTDSENVDVQLASVEEHEEDKESQPESEDQQVQTTDAAELGANENNLASTVGFTLSDPYVFDCTICSNPHTIPVYQCENGHFSCQSCRDKINNKCPSCSEPIGYKRCRGMEKVLQSIQISCQNTEHVCTEKISYCQKLEHENSCQFTPTPCPYPSCQYIGVRLNLYIHYVKHHPGSCKIITCNDVNWINMGVDEELQVLVEKTEERKVFILNRVKDPLGSFVHVSTPCNMKFSYDISVGVGEKSVNVKNIVEITQNGFAKPAKEKCVLFPRDFYDGLDNRGNNSLQLQLVMRKVNLT